MGSRSVVWALWWFGSFSLAGAVGCASEVAEAPDEGALPGPDESVLWFETGEITHDRDYYDFRPFVNPEFPRDWTAPDNLRDAYYTLRVEVLELGRPDALPIFYTVGFRPGNPDGSDAEYARAAVRIEEATTYEVTRPVSGIRFVEDGVDAGGLSDIRWDWREAWDHPRGDAWGGGGPYPFTVRVSMRLHGPPAE